MSAERLEQALAVLGLRGTVEARGPLAVLTLDTEQAMDEGTRIGAVRLALEHGFTHLALELPGHADDRAALHRD